MLDQVLDFFSIIPNYNLKLMQQNQSLSSSVSILINECDKLFRENEFDLVIIQGDTSTVFSAALAAFNNKIKIAHIEAGLRTKDKFSPFPEEMNRLLVSRLADYHFTPTKSNEINLNKEGINSNIYTVGNTVIDALKLGLSISKDNKIKIKGVNPNDKIILITAHRRENFGDKFIELCEAINELAHEHKELKFVYPVHLNPNIFNNAKQLLTSENILLLEPLSYEDLIYLMNLSFIIMTDSGGIQEEAPTLKKPILVLRDSTERKEGIENGNAVLVGTDKKKIKKTFNKLINDPSYYSTFGINENPYGDGLASKKILNIIKLELK
jgi:UDP-N-acetylglucosamine 2-epimerase (non-hydrolysing)